MVIDEIGARAGVDDVAAAAAIDGFPARTAGDRVRAGRADDRHRSGDAGGVDIGEARERGRAGGRLIGCIGEVEVDGGVEHERADPGARRYRGFRAVVIDGVGAGTASDDVRAAVAVDRVVP